MDEDDPPLLTIGQLARRTGVPARTIRYWSDVGIVPPARRSSSGYRMYDASCVARLELARTLRELGVGIASTRQILQRERPLSEVAAAAIRALDAQIRALQLNRAVLAMAAGLRFDTERIIRMNEAARLTARERDALLREFLHEVVDGLDVDLDLQDRMGIPRAEPPAEPDARQVQAWIELADLISDPDLRRRMRHVPRQEGCAARHSGSREQHRPSLRRSSGCARRTSRNRPGGAGPKRRPRPHRSQQRCADRPAPAPRRDHSRRRATPLTTLDNQWLAQAQRAHG